MSYLKASRQELLKLSAYLPSAQKVLIVSATIDIGPEVDVADLLGLNQVHKVSLPMDNLLSQAIWIDQSMPMIGVVSEEDYDKAVAKRLQKLTKTEYPILVLFRSSHVFHLTILKIHSIKNWSRGFLNKESILLIATVFL